MEKSRQPTLFLDKVSDSEPYNNRHNIKGFKNIATFKFQCLNQYFMILYVLDIIFKLTYLRKAYIFNRLN